MKEITTHTDISIREAMRKLSATGEKCLVVIDRDQKILGTLSDGDLRKAILKGKDVNDSINGNFQTYPTVLIKDKYSLDEAKKLFTENKFDLIPVVDDSGFLKDVLFWETIFKNSKRVKNGLEEVHVVIMAGGQGTRLEPFTKVLPKPLIPIHEKPVIEHILDRFTEFGVKNFILSVNYKARIMKAFFEELDHDFVVDFIEEEEPLGTAGSLKLIEKNINNPFMVTNCDILVNTDYQDLYQFHQDHRYDITLVASMKNFKIPYGTCELNVEGHLKRIREKPEFEFLVNTGLYVLNPEILQLIPLEKTYHITQLIEDSKQNGCKVGVYPIDDEVWLDIGQWAEYQKAVERL